GDGFTADMCTLPYRSARLRRENASPFLSIPPFAYLPMLDRASLRTLAQHPERNDPILNVALAEEGDIAVLFALAECHGVGPEALAKIAGRVEQEGELVGHEPETPL